jgi:hypothetical protein
MSKHFEVTMIIAPSEENLWKDVKEKPLGKPDDREINERYSRGEGRIVIETNREKLPGFVELLKAPGYLDLRPFYQRRPRWDVKRQSLLIESFIMNIPVPPVFLYEKEYNAYEVMDGQQRITAIKEFYNNSFKLAGLETWPELNGRNYRTLPDKIKAGIDRRSISSIVLLKESTENEEEASNLRETVFERLNTGGVKLERQEIRNALYQGLFNNLLEEITRRDDFREVWQLPRYVENEVDTNPAIQENALFAKMGDAELVLRFFALRHVDHYAGGMQGFLDRYQRKATRFTEDDINQLRKLYLETFHLAQSIYGILLFRPFDPECGDWQGGPHKAFQDAVLIGLSRHLDKADALLASKEKVIAATKQLFLDNAAGTFTGRGNTKQDIRDRIDLFAQMISSLKL